MSRVEEVRKWVASIWEAAVERAGKTPEVEGALSSVRGTAESIKAIGRTLRKNNPYHKGDIGMTLFKAGIGAAGGIASRALYNEVEDKSGGYGSAALMGAFAGTMVFGPSRTQRFASTFLKRSGILEQATQSMDSFLGKKLMEGVINEKSLFHLKDYSKAANVYSHIMGATRGAIIGAGIGGTYGAASDKETVLSGTFKGAFLGALTGGIAGSRIGITRKSAEQIWKETRRMMKEKNKFSAEQRKSMKMLYKSFGRKFYTTKNGFKYDPIAKRYVAAFRGMKKKKFKNAPLINSWR